MLRKGVDYLRADRRVIELANGRAGRKTLERAVPGITVLTGLEAPPPANRAPLGELVLQDLADRAALHPRVAIRSALAFEDCEVSAPSPWSETEDAHQFCAAYAGEAGVALVAAAVETGTWADCSVLTCELPGQVAPRPSGVSDLGWESIWIPNGYQQTLSNLRPYGRSLSRLERFFLDVGAKFGHESCGDVYEAHITVAPTSSNDYPRFAQVSSALGVKAIHVELPEGLMPSHFITASIHRGSIGKVKREVSAVGRSLSSRGLVVVRTKIEAFLSSSLVPQKQCDLGRETRGKYFEFHVKIAIPDLSHLGDLRQFCRQYHAHLSRTASNKLSDNVEQRFATLRIYDASREVAEPHFDRLLEALRGKGLRLSNIIREYTVFDSKPSLDDGWIDRLPCAVCDSSTCVFGDARGKSGLGYLPVTG